MANPQMKPIPRWLKCLMVAIPIGLLLNAPSEVQSGILGWLGWVGIAWAGCIVVSWVAAGSRLLFGKIFKRNAPHQEFAEVVDSKPCAHCGAGGTTTEAKGTLISTVGAVPLIGLIATLLIGGFCAADAWSDVQDNISSVTSDVDELKTKSETHDPVDETDLEEVKNDVSSQKDDAEAIRADVESVRLEGESTKVELEDEIEKLRVELESLQAQR